MYVHAVLAGIDYYLQYSRPCKNTCNKHLAQPAPPKGGRLPRWAKVTGTTACLARSFNQPINVKRRLTLPVKKLSTGNQPSIIM